MQGEIVLSLMIHRLYISLVVSLYLVLVTDLLLYLYGQLKLKAMHAIVQFEVYLTCADLRMKGRRQNLAEELNKIKVIIPQSFIASIMSSPNPSLSLCWLPPHVDGSGSFSYNIWHFYSFIMYSWIQKM